MKTTILILLASFLAISTARSYGLQKLDDDFGHFLKGHVAASDSDLLNMYQQYLSDFKGKTFEVNRDMDRFIIFKNRVREIIAHNSDPNQTWERGINHMTDLTEEERNDMYQVMAEQKCSATTPSPRNEYNDEWTPSSYDWRNKGIVSPVKDQKKCGSCWTFSTIGAMEAHYAIATGEQEIFSEQELVDCASAQRYDCHGCSGGLPSYAFNFIKDNGIMTENNYPYQAKDSVCRMDTDKDHPRIITSGPFNITSGDETQMRNELYWKGPVSVAFQVVSDFRDYKSGVYTSKVCKNGPDNVNHAVLAVGFGTEKGMDYWIVKNSWSDSWGDEGYFKIQRGVNMCGIAVCNSYPLNVRKVKV